MQAADQRKPLILPGRPDGAGTPDDPIDVQGNMTRAVSLMADGKHVRLNSPDEIKPLLDEVNLQAAAQGYSRAHEPAWDLGNVSVRGTRLFNEQTRGIPRQDMPQLNGPALPGTEAALLAGGANRFIELDPQFRAQLRRDGIDVKNERVPAGNLRATQTQLTAATVAGIAGAAAGGSAKVRHMLKEPIWVSSDNYVIDGHHRWAADEALAFSGHGPKDIEVQRIALPIALAVPYANQFAQRMGIEAKPLGNAALVETANISTQVLQFAFHPDELRDWRGRWTKGGTEQLSLHKILRAAADPFVGAPMPNEPELTAAVEKVATPASGIVPGLVGGNRDEFNGKVKLFQYDENKEILAYMDWDGTMNAASNVAQALQDGESLTDRPVQYPDAFEVIEHELIHGVVPAGSAKANERSYQVWSVKEIEEGFTELGAIQHAPEFFRKIGMYDREAGPWPGHTVGEMAENMTHPDAIASGNTWGHYDGPVKDAQDWVQQIAKEEGSDPSDRKRLTELSDQVNRMGSDGKIMVMAHQLSLAMTHNNPKQRNDQHYMDTLDAAIMEAILKQWNTDNPEGAAKQAFGAAKAVAAQKMQEMAEMGSAA